MPNYAERYATARYHYAELCRIMLLCRLCRTHAIMPIYYAGIKWNAQVSDHLLVGRVSWRGYVL